MIEKNQPRLIALLARRSGIDHAAFRAYYEAQHAPLALTQFGDLFASYRRYYLDRPADYDVVTEIIFHHRAAMDEMFRRTRDDPDLQAMIAHDEAQFTNRSKSKILISTDCFESPGGSSPLPDPNESF